MNYYIDTEFLEGTQKEKFPISLFRKETKPTIDLISIGIVSEDDREYYAISKDFNLEEAWNRYDLKTTNGDINPIKYRRYGQTLPFPYLEKVYWIRENVLKPIWLELTSKEHGWNHKVLLENLKGDFSDIKSMTFKNLKKLIKKYGKTNKQISEEIIEFTEPTNRYYSLEGEKRFTHGSIAAGNPFKEEDIKKNNLIYHYPASNPKFYAYYADYDWVVFCWLFGKMMDLPKGFPMYCRDLKQDYDFFNTNFIERKKQNAVGNIHKSINELKDFKDYPKQENNHNALADARWNKKLHEFLNKI